jgi:hypothetical protein
MLPAIGAALVSFLTLFLLLGPTLLTPASRATGPRRTRQRLVNASGWTVVVMGAFLLVRFVVSSRVATSSEMWESLL